MDDRTEHGIPRAVAIAWGMAETPQRGPRRGLSHERIVEAAIEIADADGLAAVTMQRVAQSLGFTTMSLYRYVANKSELLTLMQDAASKLPEVDTWPPTEGWQEGIRQLAIQLAEIYQERTWMLELPRYERAVLMPNAMQFAERAMAVLEPLPLDTEQRVAVILNLAVLAEGFCRLETNLAEEEMTELDADDIQLLSEVITTERFPHLAPLVVAGSWAGSPDTGHGHVSSEFERGLQWLISGIERLAAEASSSG